MPAPPTAYPVNIVDVFAESPLAGNQLAVVREAGSLNDAQMQAIAREMNFSETTFVTREAGDRSRVRIFTPEFELPFAGHPTIGTAWVLAGGQGEHTLELDAGDVPVQIDDEGIVWMVPPPVALQGAFQFAPALLGLTPEALHPGYPASRAECGPSFALIGLRTLEDLRQVQIDQQMFQQLQHEHGGAFCLFLFTDDAYGADADFAARMFFLSAGLREDAATGSANTAFAAYLQALREAPVRAVVDQGVEMRRPARIYLDAGEALRVGGRVCPVLQGVLSL